MAKINPIFICSKCDAQTPKWSGRCLECGAWGTVEEAAGAKIDSSNTLKNAKVSKTTAAKLLDFKTIANNHFSRLETNINELDQLLGGGIVPGSLILMGGEPGIGKSTLMLQILKQLDQGEKPLLYLSGEESGQQVKLRADRLNYQAANLKFLSETNAEQIIAAIISLQPQLAIIDSIQTIYSEEIQAEAGAVSQIRACTVKLLQCAKQHNIPIIITGHVTKDGAVAGPKTLEHLVDVVIYLEGDKYHGYRVLRSAKNRFGSTNEIGIFEMTNLGLQEVKHPSQAFLHDSNQSIPGAAISCFAEGTRAFLTEIQALVTPTVFGYPQRKTSGFDLNRLQMLTAVITKRAQLNLANQDIHLNVVGGFKVKEPALDLAVCAAIISAFKNIALPRQTIILGEVGLGGEIRPVHNLEKRLLEAQKLNFTTAMIPAGKLTRPFTLKLIPMRKISELGLEAGNRI